MAVHCQQFFMGTALHNRAAVEDDNLVGITDGRDTMRDQYRRSSGHHFGQVPKDLFFCVSVNARERVIKDQNARVADDSPLDGHSLLLAAGERQAAFSDHGFKPFRQTQNFRQDVGNLGGVFHVAIRNTGNSKPDVFPD